MSEYATTQALTRPRRRASNLLILSARAKHNGDRRVYFHRRAVVDDRMIFPILNCIVGGLKQLWWAIQIICPQNIPIASNPSNHCHSFRGVRRSVVRERKPRCGADQSFLHTLFVHVEALELSPAMWTIVRVDIPVSVYSAKGVLLVDEEWINDAESVLLSIR